MNDVSQDELQIRRLLEQYMRYNDDRALDRLLSLFTSDAIYRVGGGEHVGHEGMRRFLGGVGFKDNQPHWTDEDQLMVMPRSMHIMSNPIIEVDGNTATAELEFVVMGRDENGRPKVSLIGRYRDRLRKDPEKGWLIAERTGVSIAKATDQPGHREPMPRRPEA
jgi:3-phenylpropionate/cinnamic acid dioxygenase small subunit